MNIRRAEFLYVDTTVLEATSRLGPNAPEHLCRDNQQQTPHNQSPIDNSG